MTIHRLQMVATKVAAMCAGMMLIVGAVGCSAATPQPAPAPTPKNVKVAGTIIATAGSSNEADVIVPDPIKSALTALGAKGSGVELVQVSGNAVATTIPVDLTGDGDAQVTALTDKMNGFDADAPGRSALAGLDAIKSPAGDPVWVFSPLLDTKEPLDFNSLAFDESPSTVVKAVRKAHKLPKLTGRQVTFVVTPIAGEQKKLSNLQVGYQRAVWEGLARSAGAKKVTFFVGSGTTPGTGTIPAVAIPDPNAKINSEQKDAKTTTCTLPSPALFVSDQATLIDKKATLKALKDCAGKIDITTKITVEGHTAGVSGSSNSFSKSLSTRRATEVAALLRELKVPAGSITKVVGYGSSRPLVKPGSDPRNRAVVVTFTSAS